MSMSYAGFSLDQELDALPHQGWRDILAPLAREHGLDIQEGLSKRATLSILPHPDAALRAFRFFEPSETRVVIIGQDCYPTPGMAMGLCFSVPQGVSAPPSLRNVYKELRREYPDRPRSDADGDLTPWAEQGVLMLNTALTVTAGHAGSHLAMWSPFTARVIEALAKQTRDVCFMLWGAHAKEYQQYIPADRGHLILHHSHPSPLARRPFEGCGHFGKANAFLRDVAKKPEVAW